MRRISLEELTLDCFKSFTQPTTVTFTTAAGFKFLGGDNQKEPRLGANGAGKTTLWEGAVWTTFGTGIKGQKASDLVSWGSRRPYGAARWQVEEETFLIERWGSPDVLQVDGVRTDQAGVDALLGTSKARFLQSVIFGQGVKFFVDLSVPERGVLLDEVLDLGLWLRAGELAGKKAVLAERSIAEWQQGVRYAEGKLAGLPDMAELAAREAAWAAEQAIRLEEAIGRVEAAGEAVNEAEGKLGRAQFALDQINRREIELLEADCKEWQETIRALQTEHQIASRQSQGVAEHLTFLRDHANCPTCRQKFPAEERRRNIAEAEAKLADFTTRNQSNGSKTNQTAELLHAGEGELAKLTRKRDFLELQVRAAQDELTRAEARVDSLVEEAERIGNAELNPYLLQIEMAKAARAEGQRTLDHANAQKLAEEGKLAQIEYWRAGFKRVRLFMVRRILTHLEIEVSYAAEILGLSGWRIEFVTETETKSGSMRQGVQVRITSPEATAVWESWSGGEGQRIRLAVALGFASMIQRMAGVDYGFEVWDEPSAWLSPEGIEDLLECLKYRAETASKSVWLLDHRALIHSGFSEIWQVTKTADGSAVRMQSKIG